ncbi:outer membrane lipoprotein carrier protein LolA [Bacillus songklensis]|uniref:Outer membrane lipoprotein carrier protein LolA n=1 Tax=Bacillus songklensis TaxID=1069116 RepID=A0ABV8AYW3_9BACI
MRKVLGGFLSCFFVLFLITGCGAKSQEDVKNALDAKLEEMTGYKAKAKMTLKTGKDSQVYEVEVWHSKPSYYRVNLKNAAKDQSQMILRNDEGVFVLTPALNKSFRFQSDWPQNSSQAYLYESLARDIMGDSEAKFKATKDAYVFETKTNYQNSAMLPTQEITLNKKDLTPRLVKIMDTDRNPLIEIEFSKVELNAKFDKGAFETKRNMTGAQMEVPTLAQDNKKPLEVKIPMDTPAGTSLVEEKEVKTENGKRIVLTYGGEKTFTLIQEQAVVKETAASTFVDGEPIDLGFAIGALSDQTLTWSSEGTDFMLASKDLTKEEMIMVARSMEGQMIK